MLIQIGKKGLDLLFINPAQVMCATVYKDQQARGYRWMFEIEGAGLTHAFKSQTYKYESDAIDAYIGAYKEALQDGVGVMEPDDKEGDCYAESART